MKRLARLLRRPCAARAGLVSVLCIALGGCTIAPPRAWERDLLARPAMAMDADPLEQRFLLHIYSSKENSSGGNGVGGGGCGCN